MRPRVLPVALFAVAAFAQDKPSSTTKPARPVSFVGELSLVRFDLPIALSDGHAPTRQIAVRKDGDEAVDWPDFTLNGAPIFRNGAQASLPLRLRRGAEARP